METRHEQQDTNDPQRKGLSEIIREGKSDSLNRAKKALKRRLLQTLVQQVLDEMQDADEVAREALQHLEEDEDALADVKEVLKARLMAQIMEEAIAEIDEEVAGGEDLLGDDGADAPQDESEEDGALFEESTHTEETFTATTDVDADRTGGAIPAQDPLEEEPEADDEVDDESEPVDEERPEASAASVWTWNEPTPEPAEAEEDLETDLDEPTPVVTPDEVAEEPHAWEEDASHADDEADVEPMDPVEFDLDAPEMPDEADEDVDDAEFAPERETDDERPLLGAEATEDDATDHADAAYLDDAFSEWAEPDDSSDDEPDFLQHDADDEDDLPAQTGGDTAPFKDFETFDSALTFEDDVPPVEDTTEEDALADPTSSFSLQEYDLSDFGPSEDHSAESGAEDVASGVEAHPAVDESIAWEQSFHEPEAEDGQAYYVYGVISSEDDLPDEAFPQGGIEEEHPIFIVQEGGVRALVSRVPAETYEPQALQQQMDEEAWAQSHVRRHEHIIEQLMAHAPLVPMQFGTVYPTEIALRDMLRDQQAIFQDTLDRLEGNQEWALTIRCDLEALRRYVMEDSEKVQELLQDMRSKPRGVAQFIKKQMVVAIHDEVQDLQETCIDNSHEALSKFAEDVRVHTPDVGDAESSPVHSASYLVRKPNEGDFMGEAERLRGIYGSQGFTYEVSGPWPPYSFAVSPEAASPALEAEDAEPMDLDS